VPSLSWLQNEWAYLTSAVITIFFIIDPFAAIPIFLTLTERYDTADRLVVIRKSCLYALTILIFFAISGMKFFSLFGISLPAFQIAGGLLLMTVGMGQLNHVKKKVSSEEQYESLHRDDITVFPLTTPLLAGPGAISTVILFASEAQSWIRTFELLLALTLCVLACYGVLLGSRYLNKVLGKTGLNILTRIMGIVLTAIAVQFILNGVRETVVNLQKDLAASSQNPSQTSPSP
jgi:multiple antibiotic resistance protein